jgi:SMC interacting uncharacterized protein involved in chromosome segregation
MTDLIEIPNKELERIKEDSSPLIRDAESIIVTTEEEAEQASLFLSKVSIVIKEVEDRRTSFTKPINDGLKAINESFKTISVPLMNAKKIVGDKILAWRKEENKRIEVEEERRRKIQEAHAEMGHQVNEPVELQRVAKKIGFAGSKEVWKFKLADFAKLPDKYKVICDTAINQAIREGVRQIDGLDIYKEEVLVTSTR